LEPTLERAFIEYIHDVLVGLWMPYDEHVDPSDFKDINLLESSVGRPFQTFGGEDLFPTITGKAAALFHALVCNHCFKNGNKRTAVIALDFFFMMNGRMLAMTNEEVYEIASHTAKANMEGRKPDDVVSDLTQTFEEKSVVVQDIDPNSEAAKAIGADRVKRMLDRMKWFSDMLHKLVEHLQAKRDATPNQTSQPH
jgi:death-on-curing family protein